MIVKEFRSDFKDFLREAFRIVNCDITIALVRKNNITKYIKKAVCQYYVHIYYLLQSTMQKATHAMVVLFMFCNLNKGN